MPFLYLLALGWLYVVGLMAIAEGTARNGTWLGAFFTFVLYGALPLGIALYLFAAPLRRRARRARDAEPEASAAAPSARPDPDGGGHPAGDAVAPVRKEP